jgi:SAM-dependent methyltransferase
MRWLPLDDDHFDAAICLWNSFGYFDDAGNDQVVSEIARVLAPGGRLVLDVPNRDFLVSFGVLGRDWEQDGESYVLRSRQLEPSTSVLRNDTLVLAPDGGRRAYQMRIRCYTLPELRRLLASSGLEVNSETYGEYDESQKLSMNSYQIIVAARKME